ncbi:hypothetical protein L484_012632 [Morus notabilis]|uniref:Serpin domain-containing protein n=1 Tax=Morus notabilis TaxID=981085 RepID=W9SXY2_9ROSA|nr:hypothetical protein L484_012632 [Morus notabilis]
MGFSISVAAAVMLEGVEKEDGSANNAVLSPLSINMALNMLAAGSAGTMLDQFLEILGSKLTNDLISKSSIMMSLVAASNDDEQDTRNRNEDNTVIKHPIRLMFECGRQRQPPSTSWPKKREA